MKPFGRHRENQLTAVAVRRMRPGRHADGRGLYLLVEEPGSRRWVLRVMANGRRRDIGIGSAHDVSLADAREKARELRKAVKAGADPVAERRARAAVPTFGEFADAYVESKKAGWKNEKHVQQWQMTLRDYCAPIRAKRLNEIDTEAVLSVLRPTWETKPETTQRLRGRIESVLDAAKVAGHRTGDNPARWKGHLEHRLSGRKKLTRGHHRALPYERVPAFMALLREQAGEAARLLEYTILTCARSNEARGCEASELELAKGVWTVPAARMKAKRDHRVPLSERALTLAKAGKREGLAFPSRDRVAFSDMTMAKVVERMGFADVATVHGMRATFRTWVQDCTDFPSDIAEAALAHTISDKTMAAYARGELFEKRRKLMTAWADYCASGANVLKFKKPSVS